MPLNTAEVSFPRIVSTVTTPGIFIFPRPQEFVPTQPRIKNTNTASSGRKETLNFYDQWMLDIAWSPISLLETLDGGTPAAGVEFGTMDSIRKIWEAHRDGTPFTYIRHEQLPGFDGITGGYPENPAQRIHDNSWTVRFQDRQVYEVRLWENAKDNFVVRFRLEEVLT